MRCWLLAACLLAATPAVAQRTVAADKPIAVRLEVGQPTSLAFPEVIDSVQAVRFGEAEAPRRLSVDMRGPYCYLILNDATYAGRMFVLGKSGKQYLVTFHAATPGDVVVHILPAKAPAPPTPPVPVDAAGVLRALWTQQPLPGAQVAEVAPPAMPDPRVTLVDSHAMEVAGLVGLVLRVRNVSEEPVALDLRTEQGAATPAVVPVSAWVWAPRLTVKALAIEQDILDPGQDTRLYLVLERRGAP